MSLPSGQGSGVEVPESRVEFLVASKVSSKLSDPNLKLKSYTEKKAKKKKQKKSRISITMSLGVSIIIRFPINIVVKGGERCYGFMLCLGFVLILAIVIFFDAIDQI